VLDPCKRLQKEGFDVTFLEPGADGMITAEMVKGAMREDTILVSLMWANNEIGTINEIREIGALVPRAGGHLPHGRDAVGREDADGCGGTTSICFPSAAQDLRAQGRGRVVRAAAEAARASAVAAGRRRAGRGFRSGTLNVTGIVGLGKACEIAMQEMEKDTARLLAMRTRLENTSRGAGRGADQRASREAPAADHEHLLRLCRGRESDDGGEGDRVLVGFGVHERFSLEPSYVLKAWGSAMTWRTRRCVCRWVAGRRTSRWTTRRGDCEGGQEAA
jgi:cysteine desulfurase